VVVVGYPEVTDAGNGGSWEWRPLGMAALNRKTHVNFTKSGRWKFVKAGGYNIF